MFGFINIYKPVGKTSHDVVAILRRITKVKQIGHTGTLDPFAEGVLPVCIGKATRLIEYLKDDKAYIGTIQFGNSTNTYDTEGECVNFSDKKITIQEVESALEYFKGEIEQLPPIYSAIKVNGKKLYEYARKGENVEIKPRKVLITDLKLISFNFELQQAEIYIACSKGTYIRSIANDLGEKTGAYGHLIKLVRVQAGEFKLDGSIKLENLQTKEDVENNIASPLEYLDYPKYELNDKEKELISHGMSINIKANDGLMILTYQNEIAAIAEIKANTAKVCKVFI